MFVKIVALCALTLGAQGNMTFKEKVNASSWIIDGKVVKIRDAAVQGRKLALVQVDKLLHTNAEADAPLDYKKVHVSFAAPPERGKSVNLELKKGSSYILFLKRESPFGEYSLIHDKHGGEPSSAKLKKAIRELVGERIVARVRDDFIDELVEDVTAKRDECTMLKADQGTLQIASGVLVAVRKEQEGDESVRLIVEGKAVRKLFIEMEEDEYWLGFKAVQTGKATVALYLQEDDETGPYLAQRVEVTVQ